MKRAIYSTLLLIFLNLMLQAQNITGSWEGIMIDEYFKMNVVQSKNELCGYTYDVVLDSRKSHCKSYFLGQYNKSSKMWVITGTHFIENSGDHVLMTIRLWRVGNTEKNILRGNVSTSSAFTDLFGLETGDNFWLRKVSNIPEKLPGNSPTCFNVNPEPTLKKEPFKSVTKSHLKKDIPKKPLNKPLVKLDSAKLIIDNKNPVSSIESADYNDSDSELISEMNTRKKNTVSTLKVDDKNIQIKLYDNGSIDNDTVSIFFNGKLLKYKQRLTEEPIVLNIKIEDTAKINELIMFADNLGSIAPNTALIVVTAGKKRFEIHSSSNLNENAVLLIEYDHDKKRIKSIQ